MTRQPRSPRPGAAGIYDFEYERNGVTQPSFDAVAPRWKGGRRVEVTQPADLNAALRLAGSGRLYLLVRRRLWGDKTVIVLVMDNLNGSPSVIVV